MIREIIAAFTDPLAGTYLNGWVLIAGGALGGVGIAVLFGIVMIVSALLAALVITYAE